MRHASACFQLIFAATRGRVAGIGCWGNRSVSAKKKPASTIPAAKLALYERLIATDPTIERKGATVPYTSTNGKMFTFLSPTGELRIRLPDEERETFMKKYRAKLAVSYGIVQKDFVAVPAALLARTAELKPYLAISRAYGERLGTKAGIKRVAAHGRARRPSAKP